MLRYSFLIAISALMIAAQTPSKFELPAEQRTGSIKRILVLAHSHLDIGFTLPPDQVARDYKDSIDAAMRLARENPDFRWTIESSWMLGEWLRRTTDKKQIEELGRLLHDGRFALGAALANMHSGLVGEEEMNRLVYLGESFRRRFGIAAEVAYQNDVPGFSWAYPRVFAGSSVKYLVTGLNLFIGGGNNLGVRNTPFYWVGPDGSRVLTWFTYDSYVEGYRWNVTSRASLAEMEKTVPRRLAWLEQNGYPYDTYLLMASVGDNADPMHAYRTLTKIREWNRQHPELPMQMCTAEEFFHYIVGKYGTKFREAAGDATGHWEPVKLGAPEVAARMREASSLLPAAEALATADTLLSGAPYPAWDFADAWRELLTFHEHTAGAGAGWPGYYTRWQTDWSNTAHYAAAMNGYSNTRQLFDKAVLHLSGETGISDPAQKSASEEATVLVYNGLSWERGGPVEVSDLPAPLRTGALEVVDCVTNQSLSVQDVPRTSRHVVFFAPSIPPMGYRLFKLRKPRGDITSKSDIALKASINANGRITSLRSADGIEMIRANAENAFGALLFAKRNGKYLPLPLGPAKVETHDGPVSRLYEITREGSPLIRVSVTLFRGADYADLEFDVDLQPLEREAGRVAIALPTGNGGQLWLDGAGFSYRVPQDILPGGGAHQIPALHFAHFQTDGSHGVTVANRDATLMLRDGTFLVASTGLETKTRDEGTQTLARTEPRGSNIQRFRFRLAVQPERREDWERFGQELNLPLQASVVTAPKLAAQDSFFSVNNRSVHITAFKPAEARPGWYVLRLQEIGGQDVSGVKITSKFRFVDPVFASTVEAPTKNQADLTALSFKPWQTVTILCRIEPTR
jgi:hypothetical protein